MVEIIDMGGKVISRSKNMAQLRRKLCKHTAKTVTIDELGGEATLLVRFHNGDWCECHYKSLGILCDVLLRWRNLADAELIVKQFGKKAVNYHAVQQNPYLQAHRINLSRYHAPSERHSEGYGLGYMQGRGAA